MQLYTSVLIMFIASFVLSYAINESISLDKNITNNMHKFYMSLFMAFQMALIELIMYYYFMGSTRGMPILFAVLVAGVLYSGYKLRTLNFLDSKQYLLSMISHHQNALAMSEAYDKYYQTHNPRLRQLIDNIVISQTNEINLMRQLLKEDLN